MNKYKKLASNTLIFAIGTFGSKIIGILLTILYSKNMDPSVSGLKDNLELVALFLQPIFTFALQEYMIRFGFDKEYDKKKVFSTSTCITVAGMIALILIVPALRFIPFLDFMKGFSFMLSIFICTSSLRMLFSQFVRARDMVKLYALDGVLAILSLLIFSLIFIAGMDMGVKGYMLSVIFSDLLSVIFLYYAASLRRFFSIKDFSLDMARKMFKFGIPLIPTIVMWTVTSLSDRLFLTNMKSSKVDLGLDASGIYYYANRIPSLLSMLSTVFFQAWNMSAISENNSSDRNKFYQTVYSAYESILFIGAAGLIMICKPITEFLVRSDTYEEYGMVYVFTPILIVAAVFTALNQFLGGIYSVTKHTQNSFWTSLTAGVSNLILNWAMIPVIGIHGAAIATLMSYYLCFWARIIDARYYIPFKFEASRSFINTGLVIAMSIIVIAAPPMWWLWNILIFAGVTVYNFKPMLATVKKVLKK